VSDTFDRDMDRSRLVPLGDALALLVFVAVGVLTHETLVTALVRDALYAVAFAFTLLFVLIARQVLRRALLGDRV
jgi:uncharacterized membrane protein